MGPSLMGSFLAALDPGRWWWSPGFGPMTGWLGIGLSLVALGVGVRSIFWWRASGPVGERERAWLRHRGPSQWLLGLLGLLGVGFPLGLGVGTLLVVFQWSPRTALLLVSRENRDADLPADWQAAAQEAGRLDVRWLDVGPVVNRALGNLAAQGFTDLRPENKALFNEAAEVSQQAVEEAFRQELKPVLPSSPASVNRDGDTHGLPGWLVESIEAACLRLFAARVNTGRMIVLTGDRRDALGQPAWEIFRKRLEPAPPFLGKAVLRLLAPAVSEDRIHLVSAELLDRSPGGPWQAIVVFAVPPQRSTPVTLETVTSKQFKTPLPMARTATSQLRSEVVNLEAGEENSPSITVTIDYPAGTTDTIPLLRRDQPWSRRFYLKGGPAGWRATLDNLLLNKPTVGTNGENWWLAEAFGRLHENGNPLAAAQLTAAGAAPQKNDLVLDAGSGHGILIYLQTAAANSPAFDPATRTKETNDPWVLWSREPPLDTIFSLSGVELPAPVQPTRLQHGTGVLDAAAISLKNRLLSLGQPARNYATDVPIVSLFPDPRQPELHSLVWVGLWPEENGSDELKTAAVWTEILSVGRLCLRPAISPADQPLDAGQRPVDLLQRTDFLTRASADAYAAGSWLLAGALLVMTLWTLAQAALQRR